MENQTGDIDPGQFSFLKYDVSSVLCQVMQRRHGTSVQGRVNLKKKKNNKMTLPLLVLPLFRVVALKR